MHIRDNFDKDSDIGLISECKYDEESSSNEEERDEEESNEKGNDD